MNILVTGSTGFVGQNLMEGLSRQDHGLICLVRPKKRRSKTLRNSPASISEGDLRNPDSLKKALSGVDVVIHLAAAIKSRDNRDYVKTNIKGTQNLVSAAVHNKVKHIIFLSTSLVKERNNPYGLSKRKAEKIIIGSGMKYTIFRPTLIYGKGDTKNLTTLAQLIKKVPFIPVWGNGNYLMQPIHVSDIVKAIISSIDNKRAKNKIYDIAGLRPISFNTVVDSISAALGKKRIKIHIPLFLLAPLLRVYQSISKDPILTTRQLAHLVKDNNADISKARKDLDLTPLSFEKGIRMTIRPHRGT